MKWNLISHNHRYAHYTPISSRVSFPPLPLQAPPKPSVSSPYIYPRFLCRHPSPQFSSTPLSCLQFSSHPCHPMPSVRLRALDPPVFTPAHIPPPPCFGRQLSSLHIAPQPPPLTPTPGHPHRTPLTPGASLLLHQCTRPRPSRRGTRLFLFQVPNARFLGEST